MWQLRIVAPLSKEMTGLGFNLLPRLTLRNNEAIDGKSGNGNAELFVLAIPFQWATGRFGIGPQVDFPADSEQYGSKEWRYGLATAVLQRAAKDKLMLGILVQQLWGTTNQAHPSAVVASPSPSSPLSTTLFPGPST